MSQSNNQDLYSVLLPVYKEQDNLPLITYLLMKTSEENNFKIELIIIEDNSPDKTREIAHQLAKMHSNIVIIERPGKQGLGSAYRDGIKKAKGNFVIIMDADLSHHPKYIPEMIKKQKENDADIVTGTRYIPGAGVQGWNFKRKLTSRVANFLASWTLGSSFSDLTGSFRVYKKQVLETLIAKVTTKGYSFQMQILIRAWRSNMKIVEQPIVFVDRIYGESKLGPNQIFLYLKGMFQLFGEY